MKTNTKTPTPKTSKNTNTGVSAVSVEDVFQGSFDTIYQTDEKERAREISYQQKKEGKKVQLVAKLNDLNLRIMKAETRFNVSLTDPTIDTVQVAIEVKCLKEEHSIAKSIFNQLFPDTKLL